MSGALNHSPASIVRQMLVDLGLCTDPEYQNNAYVGDPWPAFVSGDPANPDNRVVVYDTQGRSLARSGIDGKIYEYHGFQLRLTAITHSVGFLKSREVALALDMGVLDAHVLLGNDDYLVHSVNRTSDVLAIGKATPTSKCSIFTINATASIRKV